MRKFRDWLPWNRAIRELEEMVTECELRANELSRRIHELEAENQRLQAWNKSATEMWQKTVAQLREENH